MANDKDRSRAEVSPDLGYAGLSLCHGGRDNRGSGQLHERDGKDEAGGSDEAGGVYEEAACRGEFDEQRGERRADDAHDEHDLLHEGLRGADAVERDGGTHGDLLRGAEDAGDDADGRERKIESPDAVAEDQKEAKRGADEIAGDEGGLERPAIDEDTRNGTEDRDGEHVGDLHAGDLLRGGPQREGHEVHHREERNEVTEGGDDLRIPEAAQGRDGEHRLHAHGLDGRWGRGEWEALGCVGGNGGNGRTHRASLLRMRGSNRKTRAGTSCPSFCY